MAITPIVINRVNYKPITTGTINNSVNTKKKHLVKNPNQIMSVATEHNSVTMGGSGKGIGKYKAGGLGNVAYEAAKSFKDDAGVDVRTFLPYHAEIIDSQEYGKYKIVRLPKAEYKKLKEEKKYPDKVKPEWCSNVEAGYVPKDNEFYVMLNHVENEDPKTKEKQGYEYVVLDDTGIKGEITSLKSDYLEKEKIPYRIFKQRVVSDEPIYFVHTPQVAAMKQVYGKNGPYKAGHMIGDWTDLYTANCMRALADAMPQLAEKEGFNPANIWLHDRQMFPLMFDVARRSADGDKFYNGYKIHCTLHNPGRDYQGYFDDFTSFLKIAYDDNEYNKLQSKGYFREFKALMRKPFNEMTEEEKKIIDDLFRPYFKYLLDDFGVANTTKMTIAGAKLNPDNSSLGTVSKNYQKEMLSLTDIARGLRISLGEALEWLISVTNGSLPAALNLHQRGKFGRGDNGLTAQKDFYSTFEPHCNEDGKVDNYEKSLFEVESSKYNKERVQKTLNKIYNDLCVHRDVLKLKDLTEIEINKLLTGNDFAKYSKEELEKALKFRQYDKLDDNKIKAAIKNKDYGEYSQKELQEISRYKMLAKLPEKELKARVDLLSKRYDAYSVYTTSIKEATQRNKEWILQEINKCVDENGEPSQEKLTNLFLNSEQQKSGQIVHGFLSEYKEGDRLFANWGRPDPQKGFSTFLQGYYEYIKQEASEGATEEERKALEEKKLHTKLLFGSGGVFEKDSLEGQLVHKYLKLIQEHDGGKFAKNVCFIEGFFPNKLVSCCDFGFFTSRFEPCGITPFESYAAGRPVASIRTGGAPDFVYDLKENELDKATGLLTKDPFMVEDTDLAKITREDGTKLFDIDAVKSEILGDKEDIPANWTKTMLETYNVKLDEARREYMSKQVAELFNRAMDMDEKTYDQLAKNCCQQEIEWAKNQEYNVVVNPDGSVEKKSALRIYLEDIFGVESRKLGDDEQRGFIKERSSRPMSKLTADFPEDLDFGEVKKENPVDVKMRQLSNSRNDRVSFGSLASYTSINAYANSVLTPVKNDNSKVKVIFG